MPPLTLDAIREEERGNLYPRHLLKDCHSALMLFAAGFYGRNDAYWAYEAGIEDVVCVDIDAEKLGVMRALYPKNWSFVKDDWLEYLARDGREYDLVSVDCPIALIDECHLRLPMLLWRTKVVLTLATTHEEVEMSGHAGWHATMTHRSGPVFWAVFER